MGAKYDFAGYVTKNGLKCADGLTIMKDAFQHNDGEVVPLVWRHLHDSPSNILGKVLLENRKDGVYGYATFNDSTEAVNAKKAVQHGDITQLSIFANHLTKQGSAVQHGMIREVSLVMSGANPGAKIDAASIAHAYGMEPDEFFDEAIITTGENLTLMHRDKDDDEDEEEKKYPEEDDDESDSEEDSEEDEDDEEKKKMKKKNEQLQHEDGAETIEDIFNSMNDKQKDAVYYMLAQAADLDDGDVKHEDEGGEEMYHNVFEDAGSQENYLTHDDMAEVLHDAERSGSLKESWLAHAADYGVDPIEYLFPEAKSLNNPPDFISREMGWVQKVMSKAHHTPFSRIKSQFANITEDEARARGYIKGKKKKEEVFTLLKRTTTPQTIYKKQKLDRDDIIDITDFDVVAWIKGEMRIMLDEEIARAILIGDGRQSSSDDKISEEHIRPIYTDDDLYTIKTPVVVGTTDDESARAKKFIRAAIKARKNYKGSGNPDLYTTEDMLTDMLLIEDTTGRLIYDTEEKLRTALRVNSIITVEVMENISRTVGTATRGLMGIIVNMADYNIGADKGGAVSLFDDFDIDYNQYKYLIETRISGALIKPFSAIVLEEVSSTPATVNYTKVTPSDGDVPVEEGWYEQINGTYFLTNDDVVAKAKTYYEVQS